jgi:aspartate kinase
MLDRISYEEMLELASSGAKVLQIRSVEMAMKFEVPVRVRSTFTRGPGTLVTKEDPSMEGIVVAGVSCDRNEARIALRRVPDVPGVAAKIFTPLSKANIVVDMIIQNTSVDGSTDLTFTVPRTDLKQAMKVMESLKASIGIAGVEPDASIAKVSIVGVGMRSHAGVATEMFKALADEGINIKMISTSEIKISAVIEEKYAELAVRALHRTFKLGVAPAAPVVAEKPVAHENGRSGVRVKKKVTGHVAGSNGGGAIVAYVEPPAEKPVKKSARTKKAAKKAEKKKKSRK